MTPTHDVTNPDEFVAILGDPRRTRILEILTGQQASVKEIAEMIDETPQVAHYHTKRLEKAGLISIVATREVRGTLEKFYRAVADRFVLRQFVGAESGGWPASLQWATEWLQLGERYIDPESATVGMVGIESVGMSHQTAADWAGKLVQVEEDYRASDQDGAGQTYVLVMALFPFPEGKAAPENPGTFLEIALDEEEGARLEFKQPEEGAAPPDAEA